MHQDRLEVPQNQVTILESQRTKMDTIKATGRRVSRSLSEMAFNLDALKEIIGCERYGILFLIKLMRFWYLSHRRPAKAQASLRIRAVSPEPSLFAHMNY